MIIFFNSYVLSIDLSYNQMMIIVASVESFGKEKALHGRMPFQNVAPKDININLFFPDYVNLYG